MSAAFERSPTYPIATTGIRSRTEIIEQQELHEARELYRHAFEMSLVGMATVGTDGRFRAVNQTLCTILGRSETDLVGTATADITHPDDRDRDRNLAERLLGGDLATYRIDKRYLDSDGGTIWVALHMSRVDDIHGRPLYMVGQIEDLRPTKAAQNAAERTETELRTLAAALPIGIYRADPNGRCVYANAQWRHVYGLADSDDDGWAWLRRIHEDDIDRSLAEISAASAGVGSFSSSFRVRWGSGEVRWVQATSNAIRDEHGTVVEFVGSVEDITPRMVAEGHLAEATLRFRRAFDNAPIGMALVSPDGSWLTVNSSLSQLLGYTESELLRHTFQDITHPDDLDADLDLVRQVLAGEIDTYSLEKRYFHRLGHTVWVNLSVSLVQDSDGNALYFVSQIEDVTARKLGEERLTNYAQKLAATNSELVEFTSVAAHDLAEPLRVIEGYLHLLSTRCVDDLSDEGKTFIRHAIGGAEQLQRLINDLLAYSRSTHSDMAPSRVDLAEVVHRCCTALEVRVAETGATIQVGELPVVRGNESQLGQLVQNLLSNALTFSRPGEVPVVSISASPEGANWVLTVADQGIGIPSEHRDRVFGMFKRLHGRDDYPGTGIGLAICRKVAEAHGGQIWVADAPTGTTIQVSLPAEHEHRTTSR